jgi:hypothetical protein
MSSRLVVNSIRHTGASADAITMDASGNVTFPANATCSGTPSGFSDFVKLQAATGTSPVADLTFQSLDVTTYRTFKMVFSGYPVTDSAELHFRFRAGSTEKTATAYNWGNLGVSGAGSVFDNAGEQDKALIGYNAGNNNYEGWRLELTVVPHVSGDPDYQNNFGMSSIIRYTSSNSFRGENFWFKYHQSDTVDGFRIYPSSGNIAAYSYTLYGLKR